MIKSKKITIITAIVLILVATTIIAADIDKKKAEGINKVYKGWVNEIKKYPDDYPNYIILQKSFGNIGPYVGELEKNTLKAIVEDLPNLMKEGQVREGEFLSIEFATVIMPPDTVVNVYEEKVPPEERGVKKGRVGGVPYWVIGLVVALGLGGFGIKKFVLDKGKRIDQKIKKGIEDIIKVIKEWIEKARIKGLVNMIQAKIKRIEENKEELPHLETDTLDALKKLEKYGGAPKSKFEDKKCDAESFESSVERYSTFTNILNKSSQISPEGRAKQKIEALKSLKKGGEDLTKTLVGKRLEKIVRLNEKGIKKRIEEFLGDPEKGKTKEGRKEREREGKGLFFETRLKILLLTEQKIEEDVLLKRKLKILMNVVKEMTKKAFKEAPTKGGSSAWGPSHRAEKAIDFVNRATAGKENEILNSGINQKNLREKMEEMVREDEKINPILRAIKSYEDYIGKQLELRIEYGFEKEDKLIKQFKELLEQKIKVGGAIKTKTAQIRKTIPELIKINNELEKFAKEQLTHAQEILEAQEKLIELIKALELKGENVVQAIESFDKWIKQKMGTSIDEITEKTESEISREAPHPPPSPKEDPKEIKEHIISEIEKSKNQADLLKRFKDAVLDKEEEIRSLEERQRLDLFSQLVRGAVDIARRYGWDVKEVKDQTFNFLNLKR